MLELFAQTPQPEGFFETVKGTIEQGWNTLTAGFGSAVGGAAGAITGGIFESVMKPIAEGLATFTGWVLTSLGSWWTGLSISSIFTNAALRELTSKELALPMVLVMMISLIVAGVRLAWSGEGRGLRDIAAGLLVFVMVVPSLSFYFVTLTAASDAFSEVVLDRAVITECVLSQPNTGDTAAGRSSGDKPAGEKDCQKDSDGDGKHEGRNEVGKAFFLVFGMAAPVAGAKAGTTVGQFLGLAAPVVPGSPAAGQAVGGAAGGTVGALAGGAIGLMGALVLVMLILLSSIIQFLMLFMRDAFLICAFVCTPIVAAGAVTPSGMERMKTMMGWIHAAILWKPAVSLMYFIAILVIRIGLNSPVENDAFKTITPVLMGFTIMLLTCIAIFPLVRLCLPWVGTMGTGGGAAMAMATTLAATVAPPIFRNTVHRASEFMQHGIKSLAENMPKSGSHTAPPNSNGGPVPPSDQGGPPLPPPEPGGPPLPPTGQGGRELPPPGQGGQSLPPPSPDLSPSPSGMPSGGSGGAVAKPLAPVPVSSAGGGAAGGAVAAKAAPAAAAGPVGIAVVAAAGAAAQKDKQPTLFDNVAYTAKSAASTVSYAVSSESARITQLTDQEHGTVSNPKNPS